MKCTNNLEHPPGYTQREWARVLQREAEEKRKQRSLLLALLGLLAATVLLAFLVYYFVLRSHDYELEVSYDRTDTVLSAGTSLSYGNLADSYASGLCIASGDTNIGALSLSAYSAALFNLNEEQTVYAKDIFTSRSPASITKIMTALVRPQRILSTVLLFAISR